MSSLLFDLTASQPSAAIKRHGGGVYIQTATLVIRDSLLNVYPDACKNCHVGDSPLRLWASLNGKVRYFSKKTATYRYLFAGGWTSRQKKKPIKNFDATKINECISGEKLADCPLKKIDFCVLREDKSTGKYEVVESFDLV